MVSYQSVLRSALPVALALTGLAGCAQLRPSSSVVIYQASLTGAQQVPPVATSATGTAEMQFNSNSNVLSWKVSYSGLTGAATGAHIHGPAAPGQNAGIVVPFGGDLNAQPMTGQQTLSPQQASALAAGQWYVNIHTARHPGGEIRGQLVTRR